MLSVEAIAPQGNVGQVLHRIVAPVIHIHSGRRVPKQLRRGGVSQRIVQDDRPFLNRDGVLLTHNDASTLDVPASERTANPSRLKLWADRHPVITTWAVNIFTAGAMVLTNPVASAHASAPESPVTQEGSPCPVQATVKSGGAKLYNPVKTCTTSGLGIRNCTHEQDSAVRGGKKIWVTGISKNIPGVGWVQLWCAGRKTTGALILTNRMDFEPPPPPTRQPKNIEVNPRDVQGYCGPADSNTGERKCEYFDFTKK